MMSPTPETTTTRVLVWDLTTRLLHGLLAASFAGAFAIAVLVKHRSPTFAVHMLLGAIAALVVVLRVVWGFVGSRYARFRSFAFAPRAVVDYLRGAIAGTVQPRGSGEMDGVRQRPAISRRTRRAGVRIFVSFGV